MKDSYNSRFIKKRMSVHYIAYLLSHENEQDGAGCWFCTVDSTMVYTLKGLVNTPTVHNLPPVNYGNIDGAAFAQG